MASGPCMPDAGNVSAAPDADELNGVKFRHVEPEVSKLSVGNAEFERTTIGRTGGSRRSPPTAKAHTGGSRTRRRVPAACRPCSPRKPMRTLPTRLGGAALPVQWDPVRMIVEGVGQRGEGRGNSKPNQTVGSAPKRRPARRAVPNPMRTVRGPRAVARPASRQTEVCVDLPLVGGLVEERSAQPS